MNFPLRWKSFFGTNAPSIILFFITAVTSATLNTFLVRNLNKDSLAIWVLSNSLASAIGIAISGSMLRDLSRLHSLNFKNEEDSPVKFCSFSHSRNPWYLIIITAFISIFTDNAILIYILIFLYLFQINASISATLQFFGNQRRLMSATFMMYVTFLFSAVLLAVFNSLNYLTLFILHTICYIFMLIFLKKLIQNKIKIEFNLKFTKHNIIFGLYFLLSLSDLITVNIKVSPQEEYVYSGASSFARFLFAMASLSSLLFLSKIVKRSRIGRKQVMTYLFSSMFFISLLGFCIFSLDQVVSQTLFGDEQLALLKILGLQLVSLSPWISMYLPIQYLIVKNGTSLYTSLLLIGLLEAVFMIASGDSYFNILLIHFLSGLSLVAILMIRNRSFLQND